jgi:hypothetical protein
MPDIRGLTRAQTRFLRMLHKHHANFPAEKWPSPLIMRRWIGNNHFHHLLREIHDAINFQSDLHLARASVRAAQALPETFAPPTDQPAADPRNLLATLRLYHIHRNSVRKYRKEPRPFPLLDPELFKRYQLLQERKPDSTTVPQNT